MLRRLLLIFGTIACWVGTNAQITAPFTESFNSTSIPTGWTNTSANTSTNANWRFSGTPGNPSMSGTAYNPPVILDHTGNSGSIAWVDGSTPNVDDTGLLTDSIDAAALSSLYLQFWFYSNNITNPGDNNTIYVNFYDGTQWNDSIWGYAGDGPVWQFVGLDLSSYTISGKIMFEFVVDQLTAGTSFYNDILLDDISVQNVPPCPFPLGLSTSNITASTADVSWSSVTAASSYDVIYGVEGFNPASAGSTQNTTTATASLSSLMGATTYDVYLVADCAANGTSDTAGPVKFTTLCVPFTAPYSNNFDSETDGQVALCWEQYSTQSNGYARVENLGAPISGAQQLALYSGSGTAANGDTIAAISPQLSDLTSGDKQLNFFAKTSVLGTDLVLATASSSNIASSGFTVLDTIEFAAANVYEEIIYDISTANGYNGTDQYVVFLNTASTTFDYIYIDNLSYDVVPACPKPLALFVNGVPTSTTASIGFDANTGTSYEYEFGPDGFTQGTNTAAIVASTTNPINLTSLNPNTTYQVYVRNTCGGAGNSAWSTPISFTTACAAFTAPYITGFESDPQDVPPTCWADYETNAGSFVEVENFTGTAAPSAGTQALYLYSSSASTTPNVDTLMAFTPQFSDLTAGDKRIRFQANSDDPVSQLWVATASAPNTSGTITPIDTITFPTADTYQQVIVEFTTANGYNGTDEYIVLWHSLGGTLDYIRIDEFEYQTIPACVAPLTSSMGASNITANSADLSWTPLNQGGKTYIEVGFTGFTPGAGAQTVLDSVLGNVGSYSATGLVAASSYEFYVRDNCGSNGLSAFAGPFAFNTLCNAVIAPYTEDFESFTVGYFQGDENCWSIVNGAGPNLAGNTSGYSWELRNTAQTSSGTTTGPSLDNTLAPATGGKFFNADVSYTVGDSSYLLSPLVDVSALARPSVQFYLHRYGTQMGDMYVDIYNGTQWFREVLSFTDALGEQTAQTDAYAQHIIDLSPYLTGGATTVQARFRTENNGCCAGDNGLDDISFINGPACPDPSNLSVTALSDTAASLVWTGSTLTQDFKVWFGPQGFYQGTTTAPGIGYINVGPGDSLHIDTLTPNTCYEYVVKSICSATDSSNYVGPFQFCTPCSPINAPYTHNFDASATLDPCWTAINNGSSTTSNVGVSTIQSLSGTRSAEIEYWTGSGELMLVTPLFGDFDNLKRVRFSVWDDDGTSDLIVGTMSNPGDPNTFTPFRTITAAEMPDQEWKEFRVFFGTYTGSDKYVAFSHGQNTTTDQFYIDDFIYEQPTCFDPTNFTTSARTTTSVTLSWTTGGATSWEVEYGPVGFTPGTGAGTIVTATTNTNYVLGSLSPGTSYDVYVRDVCGPTDKSLWTGPLGVYTDCAAPLSGTYTIGATGDYTTFAAAASSLGICGVSGPVTFNVQPGYYNDHLHLEGIPGVRRGIPGISATNTVTFNGSGNDTLEWDGMGVQATIWVDSVSHVTFNNMYIINDVLTEGWGILITDNSDNVSITNNTIYMDSSGVFRSDKAPINVSGSVENDITVGASADSLTITGNTLYGGYYGASLYGASTSRASFSSDLVFSNNEVRNFYLSAMYVRYYDAVSITNNTIYSTVSATDEDGIYVLDCDNIQVEGNNVYVKDYGIYLNDINDGATVAANSTLINNMVVSENDYGLYLNDFEDMDVWHNSVIGEPAIRINDQVSADIQNNVFTSVGDFAFESDDDLATADVVNYNLYYSTGANPFDVGTGGVHADLAAWQTADASYNVNSLEGDPIFTSSSDLHLIGGLANDVGNNTLGITVDIDGDVRPASGSTVVDMGADEYTPVSGDFALQGAAFEKNGFCLRTNDTIVLYAENIIGSASDLSVTPLVANYDVTGPANTSGTITLNTGTIAVNDTAFLRATNIDLSIPGEYTLNAYILPNADNALALNDTLAFNTVKITVDSILTVAPKTSVLSVGDTLVITARSPFFGGGSFHFTEIMHFKTGTGAPTGGWPSWHTSDEYVEITGVPGSDLGGYTFEQWNNTGTAPTGTITFPSGTVVGPNGTAVISMDNVTASPSDFFYNGNGGNTVNWQSGSGQGVILKDPSGNIVDAAAYPNGGSAYTFPASANVPASEWDETTTTGTASGTCGIRLEGADVNSAATWVLSASSPQDPNVVNTGVIIPAPVSVTGFTWSQGGTTTTTNAVDTVIESMLSPGTYWYIATFNSPCGIYTDSVQVIVPSCFAPASSSLMASAASATSAQVSWDTTGLGATTNYEIEYGPIGYTPGTGTSVAVTANNNGTIPNMANNVCVDVYVRSACSSTDFSPWSGPVRACPTATPCDDLDAYQPLPIDDGVSALFIPWQGAAGDGAISNIRAQSGTQALHVHDTGAAGITDVVAYFDTISNGAWNIDFSLYVETGAGAYYNIQQNHVPNGVTGTNLWGGDVYFQGNGTATVTHSNPAVTVGTFTYAQGQWIDVRTVIDLDNDSIWIEMNGTSTGLGWDFSIYNGTANPLQFNGVNFYSGVLTGGTYDIDYHMDDFCITPRAGVCPAPNAPTAANIDCDNFDVNFNSATGASLVQYGAAGFTLGSGTFSGILTGASTYNISSLTVGNTYDVYLANICASGDTSAFVGPLSVTAAGPAPVASFTYSVNGFTVNFDASGSTGSGLTYAWDYGDGNTGTGMTPNHTYATGGNFTVTLTVSNVCGTDDTIITANSVNLLENALGQSLQVYPNPTIDVVNVEFDGMGGQEATIRVLELSGKEVLRIDATNINGKYTGQLDLTDLARGVYMLEIGSGDLNATRRLIKN